MRRLILFFLYLLFLLTYSTFLFSQTNQIDSLTEFTKVIPGKEYKASSFKRLFWGNNYRDEWTMPATVKVLRIDSAKTQFEELSSGNDNQTSSFHIKSAEGKEYLIRPVDKRLGKKLPEIFHGTFIDKRLKDGGSASNPYAGAPVPTLAAAAKIYSSNTAYRYVPAQPTPGKYNETYGNKFFVFEELVPGNFQSYVTTTTLLTTLNSNPYISVDEQALIKARLFDMFLNDWNRPEENWLWGETISGNNTTYVPLPVNRDQALSNYDGLFFGAGIGAGNLNYFQKFKNDIPSAKFINQREKDLDRRLLNQAGLEAWQNAAKDLQQSLTDTAIEEAVKHFPPEIYTKIGAEITVKLKERRKHIIRWANEYYHFLSKEVQVTGSEGDDYFDVQRISNNEVRVQVYRLHNNLPFYLRTFKSSETKEVRLFGLNGNDIYRISGKGKNSISIKISDGINNDSVTDVSSLSEKNKSIIVYAKDIKTDSSNSIHINHDTTFRSYRYDWFRYNRRGLSPLVFYSMEDRLYAALTYRAVANSWDKRPFASSQSLSLHYSVMELAPSITYKGLFPSRILGSYLSLLANYDHVRWQFYFGLGNDTRFEKSEKLKYYTTRTRQWIFQPQLTKAFGNNTININAGLQGIKVLDDSARLIAKPGLNTTDYKWQTYAGGGLSYSYQQLNNAIIPTKGFYIRASVSGEKNINNPESYYMRYAGHAYFYIPLTSKFSLDIRSGAITVTGNPEFYQHASIGGITFRGSARDRFRGKTAFYNTNDLRYIAPFRSWFFNGKAGVFAFCDNGRVWLPGEDSKAWHVAYGGGLIISPFNLFYLDGSLGFYKNEYSVQVRMTFPFPSN